MTEVVETDLWDPGSFQERREGPLSQVARVDEGADSRGEYESVVPVEVRSGVRLRTLGL